MVRSIISLPEDDKRWLGHYGRKHRLSTADLRRTRHWRLPDAFQAALALEHDLKLVTRNVKDFSKDRDLFVLVPYES